MRHNSYDRSDNAVKIAKNIEAARKNLEGKMIEKANNDGINRLAFQRWC